MTAPQFTDYENRTRHTFQAMMWALSYPGQTFELLNGQLEAYRDIADSLLDLETSFYCEDSDLLESLHQTGARELSPDRAAYHFYPTLDTVQLPTVKMASIGTLTYPDQAATLIIGCKLGQGGQTLKLAGPGIPPTATQKIQVRDIPVAFWELREQAIRYPRGWDILLIDNQTIVGLPRTTRIAMEE